MRIRVAVFFYISPDIMPLAIEGMMDAASKVTKIKYVKIKIGLDCTMVVIFLVSYLVRIYGLGSVGICTAFGAVFVGIILGKLNRSSERNK